MKHLQPSSTKTRRTAMARAAELAVLSIALSGCGAKSEQPIGYSPTPSTSSEAAGRSEPPPAGGSGYDFGAKEKTVRGKCGASHGVFKQSGKVSSCTARHEQAGATQMTIVEYCNAVVCRIH